ncbi:26S proteasome non-ATPase regulatory subunit 1-like [Diadema setosum]|uniref:26S proteasome non-ATPase regulatory subunit 1-like n=1 Tax=Diadema setosum TaxID=31175 RepID=UPI003B3B7E0F
MALGIACAGTGNKDALSILEPMLNDSVNYVRQGALIASAMVLIQQNEITCPKVAHFRSMYSKTISDKHEDLMAKFGAILAQGIIDAGGRNVTICLQSRTGHTHLSSVVGMLVFLHFWYWFPLGHFLSLAFTPTTVVALNSDLEMPVMEFKSSAKPSHYAYPPPLEVPKEKEKEKVATAVLSITAKAKKREKKDAEEKMQVDDPESVKEEAEEKPGKDSEKEKDKKDKEGGDSKDGKEAKEAKEEKGKDGKEEKGKDGKESKEEEKEKKKKEEEPLFEMLGNPARVMTSQLKVLSVPESARYQPIKAATIGGILMVKDLQDSEPQTIVKDVPAGGPKKAEEEDEPEPPEPFEWTDE